MCTQNTWPAFSGMYIREPVLKAQESHHCHYRNSGCHGDRNYWAPIATKEETLASFPFEYSDWPPEICREKRKYRSR